MAPPTEVAIPVTALMRPTLALSAVSEIELRYDGAAPPHDLLADLTALGWEGATPCPPPASAIDWSQPDVARGTRHTIRPFEAVTTACLRGTDRHRAVGVEQARLVLQRHGLLPDGPPEAPRSGGRSNRPDRRPAAGAEPGVARFEVVVPPSNAAEVRVRVHALGVVELEESDVWTSTTTYRGRKALEDHTARRLVVAVPEDRRDDLLVALSALRPWAMKRLDP